MKTLVKKYVFNVPAGVVFQCLTDPGRLEEFTDDIAEFNPVAGGKFSLWNENVIGRVIEITPNKILMDWKEETWDNYTRVSIKLTEENGKTHLDLIHKDIDNELFSSIQELWDESFFAPLAEFIAEEL